MPSGILRLRRPILVTCPGVIFMRMFGIGASVASGGYGALPVRDRDVGDKVIVLLSIPT
jgi:hypothetical protein